MAVGTPCMRNPDRWLSKKASEVARAKEGCNGCPIKLQCRAECLEYEAMAGETKRGTYGGLSEVERINLQARA